MRRGAPESAEQFAACQDGSVRAKTEFRFGEGKREASGLADALP